MKNTARSIFINSAERLTIGFSLAGYVSVDSFKTGRSTKRNRNPKPQINAWLEVLENGAVRILTGGDPLEVNQKNAMRQAAACELDLSCDNIEIFSARQKKEKASGKSSANHNNKPYYMDAGSLSVRYAAATARERLLELTAEKMNVDPRNLYTAEGKVFLKGSGNSWTFNEILVDRQIEDEVRMPECLNFDASARDRSFLVD